MGDGLVTETLLFTDDQQPFPRTCGLGTQAGRYHDGDQDADYTHYVTPVVGLTNVGVRRDCTFNRRGIQRATISDERIILNTITWEAQPSVVTIASALPPKMSLYPCQCGWVQFDDHQLRI